MGQDERYTCDKTEKKYVSAWKKINETEKKYKSEDRKNRYNQRKK